MPEVSTQVIWQKDQLISEQIADQSRVDVFKERLAAIRSERFGLMQRRFALYQDVLSMVQSREDLLGLFKSEAAAMYPETASADIGSVLKSVGPEHKLNQLWGKYKMKLGPLMSDLAHRFNEYKQVTKEAERAEDDEIKVLMEYENFAVTADTVVPPVAEIVADLVSVESIPSVDESTLVASVAAIDMLDPDAADLIMLQAAHEEEMMAQASYDAEVASLEAKVQAQAQSPGIKPMGLLIGGAVLAYILFG